MQSLLKADSRPCVITEGPSFNASCFAHVQQSVCAFHPEAGLGPQLSNTHAHTIAERSSNPCTCCDFQVWRRLSDATTPQKEAEFRKLAKCPHVEQVFIHMKRVPNSTTLCCAIRLSLPHPSMPGSSKFRFQFNRCWSNSGPNPARTGQLWPQHGRLRPTLDDFGPTLVDVGQHWKTSAQSWSKSARYSRSLANIWSMPARSRSISIKVSRTRPMLANMYSAEHGPHGLRRAHGLQRSHGQRRAVASPWAAPMPWTEASPWAEARPIGRGERMGFGEPIGCNAPMGRGTGCDSAASPWVSTMPWAAASAWAAARP